MEIIGHSKITSFFETAIEKNKLAQSYCFVGRDQIGKRTVARNLASKILHVDENKLDNYPDFYYLSRQVDEKTGKLKKEISIAQARQIKERLGGKSWFGGHQVVIIDEAELLNEESGNALLKLLEEAGEKRVFILLTEDDGRLLSTIRSRCQMIFFSLISEREIVDGLKKIGYTQVVAEDAASLSWGKPGKAIAICRDQELKNSFNEEINRWSVIVNSPFYKKMKAVEDLLGEPAKADAVRTSEQLQIVLEVWSVIWRNNLLDVVSGKENDLLSQSHLSAIKIVGLIDIFKESQKLLSKNINPKLVIEQILLAV